MFSIGYDIGSSSIKGTVIEIETGKTIVSAGYPADEMKINTPYAGFAEQDPELWWDYVKILTGKLLNIGNIDKKLIKSIGISYQMHGLVLVDKDHKLLRPAIIWCDSRAVEIGRKAFKEMGYDYCLEHLLNSPGNFTASKLRWVFENEKDIYKKIWKILLPGDFISLKMTGVARTTISGLSEGIFWDYKENSVSQKILDYFGFDRSIIPDFRPSFGEHGFLSKEASAELGLPAGIPVSYKAGDQPNNAFSLNVLNPGEAAATAGTSGVIYGITDELLIDRKSRVNNFAHVNYETGSRRLGVLLCINGTGILNSWLRRNIGVGLTYEEINSIAAEAETGAAGLSVLPFGNGAERVLENKNPGCHFCGIDLNLHNMAHIARGVQEGIAFSFNYGFDIMKNAGLKFSVLRAGNTNMFLSPLFAQTVADVIGIPVELYNTDGAAGAARGAALGAGFYKSEKEAFGNLLKIKEYIPQKDNREAVQKAYNLWLERLNCLL